MLLVQNAAIKLFVVFVDAYIYHLSWITDVDAFNWFECVPRDGILCNDRWLGETLHRIDLHGWARANITFKDGNDAIFPFRFNNQNLMLFHSPSILRYSIICALSFAYYHLRPQQWPLELSHSLWSLFIVIKRRTARQSSRRDYDSE